MDIAKSTDLPDLLSHLGYSLKRLGRYYTTREMDSIRIKDRRTWKRYSNGTGGDAITFLQTFEGKGFREAVEYLLDFNGGRARDSPRPCRPVAEEEKPGVVLPPANGDQRRVFAYLRKRGIAPQVIQSFIRAGLLYEDQKYHNCVFVGRDGSGEPKFACKRGTYDKDGASFKRDVAGSDKKVAFSLPCDPALDWVAVFEAPIDASGQSPLHSVSACGENYVRSLAPPFPTKPEGRLCGAPARAQRSGSRGERRSSAMSEPCRLRRGEGYGACDDANEYLQQRGPPRERGR